MRMWKGQVPAGGILHAACRHRGSWWALYARDQKLGWRNFKLAADRAPGKANYWLGWNDKRQELAHWPDASALRKQLPDVYSWVVETMDRDGTKPHVYATDLDAGDDEWGTLFIPRLMLRRSAVLVMQVGFAEAWSALYDPRGAGLLDPIYDAERSLPPIGGKSLETNFGSLPPIGGRDTHFAASVGRRNVVSPPFISKKGERHVARTAGDTGSDDSRPENVPAEIADLL